MKDTITRDQMTELIAGILNIDDIRITTRNIFDNLGIEYDLLAEIVFAIDCDDAEKVMNTLADGKPTRKSGKEYAFTDAHIKSLYKAVCLLESISVRLTAANKELNKVYGCFADILMQLEEPADNKTGMPADQ